MFNLLVSGHPEAWKEQPFTFGRDRVFEHITPEIRQRFSELTPETIQELKLLPTLFAYERDVQTPARFGWLKEIRIRQSDVLIRFEFDESAAPIAPSVLENLRSDLDIGDFEMRRTHWAVKDADLLGALEKVDILDRSKMAQSHTAQTTNDFELVVRPEVFQVEPREPQRDLVSVMMPFEVSFSAVYDAIGAACKDAGMQCQRADKVWLHSAIIQDVFSLIYRSRIVVVDFSGTAPNPNVMYETGIAHTLGRPVVPIAQSLGKVPFDLGHHRVLSYLPNREGLEELRAQLAERIGTLVALQGR